MSTTSPQTRMVRCPSCGAEASFGHDNPNRPFCSARCRLIDLGLWANEAYRVPAAADQDEDGELPANSLS